MIVFRIARRRLLLVLLAVIPMAGAGPGIIHASRTIAPDADLVQAAYRAADQLEKHLVSELSRVMPIVSTGFVNVQHPRSHLSAFGAMLGQLVASRFSQHGYRVMDGAGSGRGAFTGGPFTAAARVSGPNEMVAGGGPQAVIQGDYLVSGDVAYVSVRVVRMTDTIILTSCDFTVHLNEPLTEMADRTPSEDSVRQSTVPTVRVADPPEAAPPAAPQETAPDGAGPDQRDDEAPTVKKAANGPFATGEIALHPSNHLAARIIQTRLAELGFYRDKIDGIWKERSRKALREFKEARGLKYTLRWDMNTQKGLFAGTGQ
jgi:hypothetical protein